MNWISVEEHLPEEGRDVFLKYYNGYCVGYYDDDNFYLSFKNVNSLIVYGVTHWMELPNV
jgi:hypothetical protein